MSKTICIYHSRDLDGWMSAAIVKKWFIENNEEYVIGDTEQITDKNCLGISNNRIDFLGWDYGDTIPDLSEYDKVIMCDASFPEKDMWKLFQSETVFIWLDHHKSAINTSVREDYYTVPGIRDSKFAACELTWKYFFSNEEIPEIVRLLGRYDCFGHKGTEEEQKVLEFQYGARQCISNYEEAYKYLELYFKNDFEEEGNGLINGILEKGKTIYQYLCTEAKQTYKKAFPIELNYSTQETIQTYEFGGSELLTTVSKVKFLCVNQERFNPVNFGIDYHKEGYDGFACFWFKDGKWSFSLYNDNGEVDCSAIAKQYGGGGHKGASGMVVDTKTMIEIINN